MPGPGVCLVRGVSGPGGCLVPGVSGPRGCLVPVGVWSQGVPGLGGLVSQHVLRQTPSPLGETATAADGTHPTGMHSC